MCRNCIGCSLVINPEGKEVLKGPYGVKADTIMYLDITTLERPARGTDWNKFWETDKEVFGQTSRTRNIK